MDNHLVELKFIDDRRVFYIEVNHPFDKKEVQEYIKEVEIKFKEGTA